PAAFRPPQEEATLAQATGTDGHSVLPPGLPALTAQVCIWVPFDALLEELQEAPAEEAKTPRNSGENRDSEVGGAERGGFEPPMAVYPPCRFSKPVHSTTLPSLRS